MRAMIVRHITHVEVILVLMMESACFRMEALFATVKWVLLDHFVKNEFVCWMLNV